MSSDMDLIGNWYVTPFTSCEQRLGFLQNNRKMAVYENFLNGTTELADRLFYLIQFYFLLFFYLYFFYFIFHFL